VRSLDSVPDVRLDSALALRQISVVGAWY
jgi:hypothetical protein